MPPRPPTKTLHTTAAVLIAAVASAQPTAPGEWEATLSNGGSLYPAWIAASAAPGLPPAPPRAEARTEGDTASPLSIEVIAPDDGTTFALDVRANRYLSSTSLTGSLGTQGGLHRLHPRIALAAEDVARLDKPTAFDLTVELTLGDSAPESRTVRATIHPATRCPVASDDDPRLAWSLATRADEEARACDRLVDAADRLRLAPSLKGEPASSDEAILRAAAISAALCQQFRTLRDAEWHEHDDVRSVTVAPHDDALGDTRATTADAAALLAATFRRAGLDAVIAVNPPLVHAGLRPDPAGDAMLLVDVTILLAAESPAAEPEPMLADVAASHPDAATRAEWARFAAAATEATRPWRDNPSEWRVIRLEEARSMGIEPMRQ